MYLDCMLFFVNSWSEIHPNEDENIRIHLVNIVAADECRDNEQTLSGLKCTQPCKNLDH